MLNEEFIKVNFANNFSDLLTKYKGGSIEAFTAAYSQKYGIKYNSNTVLNWTNGISLPDTRVILKISDFFGVTVNYLLTFSHDQETESLSERVGEVDRKYQKAITKVLDVPYDKLDALQLYIDALIK